MEKEIESLKKEIEELKEVTKDNNRLLRGIHARARITMIFNIIKWAIIIGVSVGAFYYIQPFLETLMKTYSSISSLSGVGGSMSEQKGLLELLGNFK